MTVGTSGKPKADTTIAWLLFQGLNEQGLDNLIINGHSKRVKVSRVLTPKDKLTADQGLRMNLNPRSSMNPQSRHEGMGRAWAKARR